jgi:hypothetical protein
LGEEDCAPVEELRDRAAERRSDGDAEHRRGSPEARGVFAAGADRIEAGDERGGRPGSLCGPGHQEDREVGRDPAGDAGQREQPEAGDSGRCRAASPAPGLGDR